MRVDQAYATLVILFLEARVQSYGGFVHGRNIAPATPVYASEATALHSPRAHQEWMGTDVQEKLQGVAMRADCAGTTYGIKDWMERGRCGFKAPAAFCLVSDLQRLPEWLRTPTTLQPFYISGRLAGEKGVTADEKLFTGLAELFRVVVPQQRVGGAGLEGPHVRH